MKLAAIDIGTNSCRLLIADLLEKKLTPVHRYMETTRIGQGSGINKSLNEEAIERTIVCLCRFQDLMNAYGALDYRAVATSAVREASNRDHFIKRVQQECGLIVDVISGEEEARLSYEGVRRGLGCSGHPLVVDLGGGSTELVWQGENPFVISLPVGAVKAAEKPMQAQEIEAVLLPIKEAPKDLKDAPLVFVGGTATTLIAIKLALKEYKSELVHGQKLKRPEIEAIYQRLQAMSAEERLKLPGLQKKRADIIVHGVLILLLMLKLLGRDEITVSESDLMDTLLWDLFMQQSRV